MKTSYHRLNLPMILGLGAALIFVVVWIARDHAEHRKIFKKAGEAQTTANQELQQFSLSGFDQTGKKFWNLEGQTAKIDPGQTVFLEQNVTLRLKDNTLIKTDHVTWSQDKSLLRTNDPVHVTRPDATIDGKGAVGRPSENFIQINRDVTMRISGGQTIITCDGPMKIYYNENKMIFYRHVKVIDQRGVLTSKRMDVFFDNQKKVDHIDALGNVVIERGTDTTHSHEAIYTPATGSIRLEGNPEITLHKGSALLNGSAGN